MKEQEVKYYIISPLSKDIVGCFHYAVINWRFKRLKDNLSSTFTTLKATYKLTEIEDRLVLDVLTSDILTRYNVLFEGNEREYNKYCVGLEMLK